MERATRDTDDERLRDMVARLQRRACRLVTAATTLTAGDDTVLANTTSAGFTITLPLASSVPGKRFTIKQMGSANTLTIGRSGSDTIDGATSQTRTTQYTGYVIESQIVTAPATWSYVIVGSF